MTAFTEEQLRAIQRRDGDLLVSAGAGTGKTSVLVERFSRAVLEDGVAVDSILAITFTEKAAAELAHRVRQRFRDLNALDQARAAESAWISTIHGFCARLLRAHALAAGVDPEFRVLDGVESERLGIDAFDQTLRDFIGAGRDPERLRLIAAHTHGSAAGDGPHRLRARAQPRISRPGAAPAPPAPAAWRARGTDRSRGTGLAGDRRRGPGHGGAGPRGDRALRVGHRALGGRLPR